MVTFKKATEGSLTDNSYADLTDAIAYFETTLPADETAWLDLTDDALRERLLMWATRILDDSFDWIGRRTNTGNGQTDGSGQRLEWPRRAVPRDGWKALQKLQAPYDIRGNNHRLFGYRDSLDLTSLDELETDVVPLEIIEACCHLALRLSEKDRTADSKLNHLKSISSDSEGVVFRDGNVPMSQGTIPSNVFDQIRKFGIYKPSMNSEGSSGGVGRVRRA